MSHSLSLLFYIKKSKADEHGKANIYLRITLDSRRAECCIHRKIHFSEWNTKTQLAIGSSLAAQKINRELDVIKNKIYSIQFQREEKEYTAIDLRDAYLGKYKIQKMLLEIFQEHNTEVESLIGKAFAAGTAERYRTCKKHVASFIKKKYKKNDIPIQDVKTSES